MDIFLSTFNVIIFSHTLANQYTDLTRIFLHLQDKIYGIGRSSQDSTVCKFKDNNRVVAYDREIRAKLRRWPHHVGYSLHITLQVLFTDYRTQNSLTCNQKPSSSQKSKIHHSLGFLFYYIQLHPKQQSKHPTLVSSFTRSLIFSPFSVLYILVYMCVCGGERTSITLNKV